MKNFQVLEQKNPLFYWTVKKKLYFHSRVLLKQLKLKIRLQSIFKRKTKNYDFKLKIYQSKFTIKTKSSRTCNEILMKWTKNENCRTTRMKRWSKHLKNRLLLHKEKSNTFCKRSRRKKKTIKSEQLTLRKLSTWCLAKRTDKRSWLGSWTSWSEKIRNFDRTMKCWELKVGKSLTCAITWVWISLRLKVVKGDIQRTRRWLMTISN